MWINYHHLFYFKTIAEEGTVSKAAEKLRLGQPTLSAQLKQFEATLGVPLFERKHKRLNLTEQGKVALDYSKQIFRMGSEMIEVLHDRLKPTMPTLHIGALDSVPKNIVVQLVKSALQISPCQITLSEGSPVELLRELASHRMDLMVTSFLPTGIEARGLSHRSIAKRDLAFYGSDKFKFLRKGFPKSISGQPVIVPTYDGRLRQDLDDWAKYHALELKIIVESQDVAVKKLLAINGFGLIAAAPHTVSRLLQRGELFEVGQIEGISEELFIITANRKIQNSIAAKLKETFMVK